MVVAIEPEPHNAEVLHRNLDGRSGFVVLDAAIGALPGTVRIDNGVRGWGSRTARAETGIPIFTMRDAVSAVPDGELFIVKIDIEGFEEELFTQNIDWLSDAFMVVIEPHDWMLPGRHTSRTLQRAMAKHEFELIIMGENLVYVRLN